MQERQKTEDINHASICYITPSNMFLNLCPHFGDNDVSLFYLIAVKFAAIRPTQFDTVKCVLEGKYVRVGTVRID